ncbi:MAG: alpha-amylase family glycosyl hydrolase [Bacteroidota bacterium]|nr:alpha-amylase family glycosyl hydrolase [Bacteroidota bacterium]MDP4195255.1 alpha-amylase family glycosyl hydrolase [Bacteroidota bacterium]
MNFGKLSKLLLLLLLFAFQFALAQSVNISKVEPPNWWAGMKYNKIQLMVYGENLKGVSAKFNSPLLKILKVNDAESPSYSFIDVEVSPKIKPGEYILQLTKGKEKVEYKYQINKRKNQGCQQGFSPKDVIYMISPDRFADGDKSNNDFPGMNDHYNPSSEMGRHGGDIQGIIDHLDYIKDLGFTSIWINPLVENNTKVSYHGYAVTDLYKIDPRYGTNDLYMKLVDLSHQKGLKVILDHVNNHIGIFHSWIENLPFKSWLNGSVKDHHITRHFNSTIYDIHADVSAKDFNNHGWFVDEMPDLNQQNPFLAKYLIQNTLWWIESSGLDGLREDTYPYSDQKFLSDWAKIILDEYPHFNIVGEVWMGDPAFLAPFQSGSVLHKDFDTHLPVVTDFSLCDAARDVFKDSTTGIRRVYDALSKDYLFQNPYNLLTFMDNHDMKRILNVTKNDYDRFKLALTLLLTTRGIPQVYYGTEIGIVGGNSDGTIRAEFPGGFPNSDHNAFTKQGRTKKENEVYDFTHQLLQIRKQYERAFSEGKLVHFPPLNELYAYMRASEDQKVLVILNNKNEKQSFKISTLEDQLGNAKTIKDLKSGKEISIDPQLQLEVGALEGAIFEIK